MTKDEIQNLVSDLLRVVHNNGVSPGTRSIFTSMITNALTVSRRAQGTVNAGEMTIETNSLISNRTKAPIVALKWGEMEGQLSPGEARDFAERVRRTADAAESDAFVFDFLVNQVETDPNRASMVLHLFREFREDRARKDYLPPEQSKIKEGPA